MRNRLLVIANDIELRARLARRLSGAGHSVELAESVPHARRVVSGKKYSLAILVLKGLDSEGHDFAEELRVTVGETLLIGTPGNSGGLREDLIDWAADGVLEARVAEALRLLHAPEPRHQPPLQFAGYTLDFDGAALIGEGGREITLTRGEFALLREFVRAAGRVLSRDHLRAALAGREAEPYERSVDMLVVRLRRKIEPDPRHPSLIITVPGQGYKFAPMPQNAVSPAETPAIPASSQPASAMRRQLTALSVELLPADAGSPAPDPEDLSAIVEVYHREATSHITRHGGVVAHCSAHEVVALLRLSCGAGGCRRTCRAGAGLALLGALGGGTGIPPGLALRVGIATGLVVAHDVGDGTPPKVIGDTPGHASRVRALAGPGQLVVSADTYRLIGGAFEHRPLHRATNGPVGYQVFGLSSRESRFEVRNGPVLPPMVGREEELQLILRRWQKAKAGEGQLLLLAAEAGIGKSRLAAATIEHLSPETHTLLRYYCSPHSADSALYPVISQLKRAAGFLRVDQDDTKAAKLEALLARSALSEEQTGLIADLLSIATAGESPEMSPHKRKEKTLEALLAYLHGLAVRQPVLIVFEDVHWIDPTSLELLGRISSEISGLPMLLLITGRPEFKPPWPDEAHITTLTLNRLSANETAAVVGNVTGGRALPSEVMEQILRHTDGVPLFIEELTKTVLESRLLSQVNSHYELVAPLPPVSIPLTLRDSLMARPDRPASAREVAQIGAAIGREFAYPLVRVVSPLAEDELQAALACLVGAELVFQRSTPPEAVYLFKHALVQDTAHASLLRSARQQIARADRQSTRNPITRANGEPA